MESLLIVGGDFNNADLVINAMSKKMEALELLNVTSPPDTATPDTYKQGKLTINPPGLSPLVTGFGYLPYDLGFTSDHREIFVDIMRGK